MSTLSIDLKLRPIRFAFIVRPDDGKHLLKAFQINTCLWGGKYNPIIPYFKQVPKWWSRDGRHFESAKSILNGYFDFFEPDFVVEAEKGLAKGLGFSQKKILKFSDILPKEGDRNREVYGLNINNLYVDLYNKDFKFKRRHKHNIVHVKSVDPSFRNVAACIFGGFPNLSKLKYFEDNYIDIFDPEIINLDGCELLKLYETYYTSALNIGKKNLKVDFDGYEEPALFILDATEPRDLIDFWNLRIFQKNVLPIPVQWIKDLSPFCKKFILRNYRPLPGNPHGVMIHPFTMFSRSISDKKIDDVFKKFLKVNKKGANCTQTFYPSIWLSPQEDSFRIARARISSKSKRINVAVDLEKPIIDFPSIWPDFSDDLLNRCQIANVVKLSGWGDKDQLAKVFPSDYRNPQIPKFRLGGRSILSTTEGLVFFPEYKNIDELWELQTGSRIFQEWFKERKVDVSLSDAGRATQQIIQTLDGFWGVGKIANLGIIKLLSEMARKPVSRSASVHEFKEKIKKAMGKGIGRHREFETLVERKVVELGLELCCSKCGSWSWFPLKQLDYSLDCDLCLQSFQFPILNPSDKKNSRWAYRVVGPFSLPDYAKGGYAASLAIRFFADIIGHGHNSEITWSAGQELTFPDKKVVESDFILWHQRKQLLSLDYSTEIVFGETKSFGKDVFKLKDIQSMKLLAEKHPGAVIVFATLKEGNELSDGEISRIRKFAEWGRYYNKENYISRAPVIVLTGTELFSTPYLENTWKEKGGKHAQMVSYAYTRVDNLRVLADLTQQLYLGMPSYHTWLDEKYRKRRQKAI